MRYVKLEELRNIHVFNDLNEDTLSYLILLELIDTRREGYYLEIRIL
jgi:hypothetical protein